jgi:hypothetical protein
LFEIKGTWKEFIEIGDTEYWSNDNYQPRKAMPMPNVIPSDPRYREDLVWLKRGNEEYA